MFNTPILFLIFKRPDVTAQVFEAIRLAQPAKLYIAADGARPDKAGEADKVAQTRELVLNGIDWPCEVETLLRDTNLGCRIAVSSAIDWFFEHEEAGIILEDDCLPDQSFFRFCAELLEYYRHDTRIMAISGNNFQQGQQRGKYSYYFSQTPYPWGWATWRRAWRMYHTAIAHFGEIMAEPTYRDFTHHARFNQFRYENIMNAYYRKNGIDSWAYLWGFTNFVNHGLVCRSQENLVKNIGFGPEGTHTTSKAGKALLETQHIEFPLRHPPYMCLHKEADTFHYEHNLGLAKYIMLLRLKKKGKRFFRKMIGKFVMSIEQFRT